MLWNEKYKIGVNEIDRQHKELFDRVSNFLQIVKKPVAWENKIESIHKTLLFMKNYVIEHFQAEEKLQQNIGYPDYIEHKKLHDDMLQYVADFEMKFAASTHKEQELLVQEFAGRLLAWLLYHVVSTDQKIAAYVNKTGVEETKQEDPFTKAILNVLQSMFQADIQNVAKTKTIENNKSAVTIGVNVIGEKSGQLIFHYSEDFAMNAVNSMSGMQTNKIDAFILSALCEISNIISGSISSYLFSQNYRCDITTPAILPHLSTTALESHDWRHIHTNFGSMNLLVALAP